MIAIKYVKKRGKDGDNFGGVQIFMNFGLGV